MTNLELNLGTSSYKIHVGHGLLSNAKELLNVQGRALIITDRGVPSEYSRAVSQSLGNAEILTLPDGEGTKSLEGYLAILEKMMAMGLKRTDALIAVGGGVIGDLTGFAAATYMRGIAFYNIPTTLLSMVDSSIGGKTAINLKGVKNIVGAFYQPRGVLIDTETLKTLDKRLMGEGLAESIKMALTSNSALFGFFEKTPIGELYDKIDEVIFASLKIKKEVVELDEKEMGIRKILNFGHTLGHGIEALCNTELYHGECVALGMIPMCSREVQERLIGVLKKLDLPTEYTADADKILEFAMHDKKAVADGIDAIYVDTPGEYRIKKTNVCELKEALIRSPLLKKQEAI